MKIDKCRDYKLYLWGIHEGGMAEWFKAAVLKTADRKVRGFESYSLRQSTL
jgi:hypothetical protein